MRRGGNRRCIVRGCAGSFGNFGEEVDLTGPTTSKFAIDLA